MGIYRFSSPSDRAKKTLHFATESMESPVNNMENSGDSKEIKYKTREMALRALATFPEGFEKEWRDKKKLGLTDDQIFEQFLNREREIKPEMLAKPYINRLGNLFKRANKKNRKITVVSFRHGDKDSNGNLSEKGVDQSKELGKRLRKRLDNEGDTILAATHNVINETIINTIFSDETLPEEWKKLLDFTETVTYTFYPNEQNDNESYLEIDWRGTKKQISYEKFKELTEKIGK